ncbi:MAG: sensor histidine kinase [Trebonia sp.]
MSNLIDSALKWSPPGTTVSVVVEDGRIMVGDHGPGIADADLPHIFQRFYRAPGARGMPGAGLGLAIVGSVARANGGTVGVRTGPDGSVFTLAFLSRPDTERLGVPARRLAAGESDEFAAYVPSVCIATEGTERTRQWQTDSSRSPGTSTHPPSGCSRCSPTPRTTR